MRDWLYNTLTSFANNVAVRLGNRITDTAVWCNQRADGVEQARLDTVYWFNHWLPYAPWPISEALSWFGAIIRDWVVDPAFTAVRGIFIRCSELITSYYDYGSWMYVPERWLRDIIYNVRDRLINLLDDTANLIQSVQAYARELRDAVLNQLNPLINGLYSWKDAVSTWIGQNLYNPLQAVIQDIMELGTRLYNAEQSLRAVTLNPQDWIWSHVEPYLRAKIESWLNSIWYTRI